MPTPSRPLPGTAYARFVEYGASDQKEFSNDYWYSVTAGTFDPSNDGVTAGAAFITLISNAHVAVLSVEWNLRGVNVELSDGALAIGTPVYSANPGVVSGPPIPGDVAAIVRKETTTPGKVGRGRWYFAGVPQAFNDGSYLTGGGYAAYQTFAVKLKTALNFTGVLGAVTLSPAHFSRKTRLLYPIHNDPVVSLLGTKRKRRGPF
jgi:hypothetical protein